MSPVLATVLPVFGLIAIGLLAARTGFIGAAAGQGMTQFVFNLGIPALLFRTVVRMDAQAAAPWPLWLAYFGGLIVVWALATLIARGSAALSDDGGASTAMGA